MSVDIEAIKARTDISAVIGHYIALTKRGSEYIARCPFHSPDNNPSFYVVPAKGLYHCFACGASGDVINFLQEHEGIEFKAAVEKLNGGGVEWSPKAPQAKAEKAPDRVTTVPPPDAGKPDMRIAKLGAPSREWEYRDGEGRALGYVCRYDTPEGKEIRAWTWGARGKSTPGWGCGQWNKPRPLYGLDLVASRPVDRILIVEGEKAADAARELLPTYIGITWPGGAQAWKHADWAPIKGRSVLLWPDADKPGIEAMQAIAALLSDQRGLACSVRIVTPSEVADGFDLADALANGWTTEKVIEYAKPRAADYTAPHKNPAPPGERVTSSTALPDPTGTSADAGPDQAIEGPENDPIPLDAYRDEASAKGTKRTKKTKKTAGNRPRLAAVDGAAVPEGDPEADPLPVEMSEDALADHLAAEYGKDWRYVAQWGKWFKWCGDVWQEDKTHQIFDIARSVCRRSIEWPEAAALTLDGKRKIGRKATAGNVRDMAGTDRRLAATVEQWDTNHFLLGVPGGVVDLTTGELLPGEPGQYMTKKCSVAPEHGEHPLFDMVLARATCGEDDMRSYLLRWFGYVLTGDVREECFLFLHGPGGSGKGTLVKVLADILGDYAATISMEAMTETKMQRHPQELAKLASARFVYASETEEGRRWNESLIKWLTGRDKVTAHFMRENDFEFYPQFKLLIYGNHIPHLKSVGEEMRRRVHLIEYAGSLSDEERDTTLKDRLVEEYPAILHTLIRGCIEWQDTGLGKPERVSDATNQYLQAEDTLGMWLEDNVTRDPSAKTASTDVYRDFKRWAESAGEYVMSQKRFTQAMKQRGFDQARTATKRFLQGIELKTPPSYDPQPGRFQD